MVKPLRKIEIVIMLTKASEELGLDKAEFHGDDSKLFRHVVQQAYAYGHECGYERGQDEKETPHD